MKKTFKINLRYRKLLNQKIISASSTNKIKTKIIWFSKIYFKIILNSSSLPSSNTNYDWVNVVTNGEHVQGSQSLGIMIIEGRHQEVGHGIFVSDIQDGSPAQSAGLQVGDMILAVNKDTLLGCEYATVKLDSEIWLFFMNG